MIVERARLVATLAMLLALGLAFLAGHYNAVGALGVDLGGALGVGLSEDMSADREPPLPVPGQQQRVAELEAELVMLETRSEVDQAALELVRLEIAAYKEQIAALEEGLLFFKSLMSPGNIAEGLSLRDLELVAQENDQRYAFRIVVQQEARKHNTLKGQLTTEIYGLLADEEVSYTLAALSNDIDDKAVDLRFRYFQSIEGLLTLPDGFKPVGVTVIAKVKSPRKMQIRGEYPWKVQERFTHVGQ